MKQHPAEPTLTHSQAAAPGAPDRQQKSATSGALGNNHRIEGDPPTSGNPFRQEDLEGRRTKSPTRS